VRNCQTNGITADDEAFELVAQNWQIRHVATQLCVTASSGDPASARLTLQTCGGANGQKKESTIFRAGYFS